MIGKKGKDYERYYDEKSDKMIDKDRPWEYLKNQRVSCKIGVTVDIEVRGMQVNLSSGNYDIIATGETFLFEKNGDLTIDIDLSEDHTIGVVLKFAENEGKKIEVTRNIEEGKMILTCSNFGREGMGTSVPLHIANIGEKGIYLMFWSKIQGAGARCVNYTVFGEK